LALLKLKQGATAADLKRAYRRAALELHPDQNDDPAAAARFRAVTDAYRRLEPKLAPPPKKVSLQDRAVWFLADARMLMKRWSAERWQNVVDGLPAIVWLSSAIQVLAEQWPEHGPVPASPTVDGVSAALEAWAGWLELHPPPKGKSAQALTQTLEAAESRLKALNRPKRSRN
jgi:hypothetical protein